MGDQSLLHQLPAGDRRTLKRAIADGYAELPDYADDAILDLVEQHACLVLTRDQFVGHRRARPWLDGNQEQFVGWTLVDGSIRLYVAELRPRTAYSVWRAEERDELRALHMGPDSERGERLLKDVYRCDNPRCLRRAIAAEGADVAPREGSDGTAVCPSCGTPLALSGRRTSTAIVKLAPLRGELPSVRVPLRVGSSITIGRSAAGVSCGLSCPRRTVLVSAGGPRRRRPCPGVHSI